MTAAREPVVVGDRVLAERIKDADWFVRFRKSGAPANIIHAAFRETSAEQ